MPDEQIADMTYSEITELIKRLLDELEMRMMQECGDRMSGKEE